MTEQECIDEEMPVVAIPPAINYAEFAKEGTEEERANALLIRAAPDLIEACKALLNIYDSSEGRGNYVTAVMKIANAVAKAEGREDV